MSKIGVIGGSGLYSIHGLVLKKKVTVKTPFGKPSDKYIIGASGSREIVFLPRHGRRHSIPPHMINYRGQHVGFQGARGRKHYLHQRGRRYQKRSQARGYRHIGRGD